MRTLFDPSRCFRPPSNGRPAPTRLAADRRLGLGKRDHRVARHLTAAVSPHADGAGQHVQPVGNLRDPHYVESHTPSVTQSVTANNGQSCDQQPSPNVLLGPESSR